MSERTYTESGLTGANRLALAHVRAHAQRQWPRHIARIRRVLAGVGLEADAEALVHAASGQGALTLHFHPDRLIADGRSVAEALHEEGIYRSQFETGISSGGLTAHPGGDRDLWERALFGGAYQAPGVVHGVVRLAADVEAVVIDPAFAGTSSESYCSPQRGASAFWPSGIRATRWRSARCRGRRRTRPRQS